MQRPQKKLAHLASRRDFLRKGSLAAALGLTAGGSTMANTRVQRMPRSGKAKNIIFLVSDGMSQGTLSMADQLLQLRDNRQSHWMQMYGKYSVGRGLMDMSPANGLVTDSAAASSSWGCGQRVRNGRINMDADDRPLEPILHIAKRNGLRTGVVTTATVTHATPAGFAGNVARRGDQRTLARQYHERGYDVMLGGGTNFFRPSERHDHPDMLAAFAKDGYKLMTDRDALASRKKGEQKLLGLFQGDNLPFEVDRLNDESLMSSVPSLAEMSSVALAALSESGDGFLVQIEGARVDHAAHNNDISGLLYDQIAFDDAVKVALDFYESNPDTMVIVTTDHGNSNPGLLLGRSSPENSIGRLLDFKGSCSQLGYLFRRNASHSIDEIREAIAEVTGIGISNNQAQHIVDHRNGDWRIPNGQLNTGSGVLGVILGNYTNIGWMGRTHTSDYVEVSAIGPGKELIQPFVRNTDMFGVMCQALDLKV